MTVRLTQSRSGYPRRSRQPYPTEGSQPPVPEAVDPVDRAGSEGPVDPGAGAPTPVPTPSTSRVADRKAVRAARRTRRNLAILCGLVVAVCLLLTILIVDMARIRPPGAGITPLVSTPSAQAAAGSSGQLSADSPIPNRGAPAPEGGNP